MKLKGDYIVDTTAKLRAAESLIRAVKLARPRSK